MDRNEHPTFPQMEWAVFAPVWGDEPQPSNEEQQKILSHLANCKPCNNMILRERERNPLYKMAEAAEDRTAFWRMVGGAAVEAEAQRKLDEYIQSLKRKLGKKQRFSFVAWIKKIYAKLARLVSR